jgi:hypothetical protein
VIGTLVWDMIYGRAPGSEPISEWGGIAYSLEAMDAALGEEWEIVPLIRVGSDLIVPARHFTRHLVRLAPDASLIEVPWPSNRVVLTYQSNERRTEVLTGGIPPWHWIGLKPLLTGLDALYINFTSGFEFDLEIAQLVRQNFAGPIYCDLHSLLLAVQPGGLRTPQRLADADSWLRCFDMVQVNEDEMHLLAADPLAFASTALALGVRAVFVTLGSRGAVYFASPGFDDLATLPAAAALASASGPVRTALVPAALTRERNSGDPTGCGDVWGATYFSRLLTGDSFASAMNAAMKASAMNVEHRGATGLAAYLRGELATR